MSLFCLCSAHGAPGVTTTALALAGVWPENRQCLLVEADPSGGMVAARFGLQDGPGLASLAAVARRGVHVDLVWRHTQSLPGGVPVLVAPPSAPQAQAVIGDFAAAMAGWSVGEQMDVIVDCGRLTGFAPMVDVMRNAAGTLLLSRPTADQLRPAVHQLRTLETQGVGGSLLLVGGAPYGPDEVSSAMDIAVAGTMAWDPRAALALTGEPTGGRGLRRSLLVRSAASLVDRLLADQAPPSTREWDTRLEVAEEVSP